MGRTYEPYNKQAKGNMDSNFDVNYSGADILGLVSEKAGCSYKSTFRLMPSTAFKATEVECQAHSAAIQALSSDDMESVYAESVKENIFVGTYKEFQEFIKEWTDFLDTCQGYLVN